MQGELEEALGVVLRRPVGLTVAGRTDAGVHARGQVASHPGDPAPAHALNGMLGRDARVLESEAVREGFDARRDARSRLYRYRVLVRRVASPFEAGRALHWPHPLHVGALMACAAAVVGTHDFTAFTPTRTDHVRFERDVTRAEWLRAEPDVLELWIEADAFLRQWCARSWARCSTTPRPRAWPACSRAARAPTPGARRLRTASTWRRSATERPLPAIGCALIAVIGR